MEENENYELICMQIISYAGTAKSAYIAAIDAAKNGDDYDTLIKEGNDAFLKATEAHTKALQLEADNNLKTGLLLIHAESILSQAELLRDLTATIAELVVKAKQ